MPELPEVETVCRSLKPWLTGRRVCRVHLGEYLRCIATPEPSTFAANIEGRTINDIERRGKFILIRLDSGVTATLHLRMTGELSVTTPETPFPPHVHLHFDLDDGHQLRYRDVRKFGRWSLLTPEQFQLFDQSIGPEPLDGSLTPETFANMLRSRKRILKPLLLDQRFMAGIGNIYADEALFRAGIHPRRNSSELTTEEASRLLDEIRSVLNSALENRGTTLRDYRDANGEPGENLARLQIYSRNAGEQCPRCGTPIVREVIGQRGTKICPHCQPINRDAD
jgi:formamidopyrimidine-DNA glycosylase